MVAPNETPGSADHFWIGNVADKLFLQSGAFTSTVRESLSVTSVDTTPLGVAWDGTNTPWCGSEAWKLYLTSGQFTSTIKTSQSVGTVDAGTEGISWDGNNTPWSGTADAKYYLQSGQFTSTVKTSLSDPVNPSGISWDGTNTPGIDRPGAEDKLVLYSGQFTSTIKASVDVNGTDAAPADLDAANRYLLFAVSAVSVALLRRRGRA